MSEPSKKRPWFQFHLSTAVVVMLAAAALLWANLCLNPLRGVPDLELIRREVTGTNHPGYGWPWPCVRAYLSDMRLPLSYSEYERPHPFGEPYREFLWWPLAGDIAVALAMLCAVGWGSERFARRHRRGP